jgi:ABC-type Fe3+/spermidine/putrescine transport system ATPase subunit
MSFLSVEHVGKRFGSQAVLHDVGFTVKRGAVATLLGPSGCGKTTMLRAIAGLEHVDQGRVTLGGRILADGKRDHVAPEKRGIGMVFQSYALWPHKTVAENVGLGLLLRGTNRTDAAVRAERMLALVGLPGIGARYPGSLSGGQQQRVSLARALALEPACLLFDEPLSNLDLVLREQMRFEIRAILVAAGITAVYVTHDQSEAMVISDQLMVMDRGRIVQSGPPAEVYRRPKTRFVAEFLGRANLMALDQAASNPAQGLFASQGVILRGVPAAVLPAEPLIAFRPESVSLSDGADRLDATVLSSAFLGNQTQCQLQIGALEVTAAFPSFVPMTPGQHLHVSIAPEGVTLVEGLMDRRPPEGAG